MKTFLAIIACFFMAQLHAQQVDDLLLVEKKQLINPNEFSYYKGAGNTRKMMESHSHSIVEKVNPISYALKAAMFVYQNVLSPQLSKACPYQVTCSNFGKQAITKFGILKGVFITADRLMRCNRIALQDLSLYDIDETNGTIVDPLNRY